MAYDLDRLSASVLLKRRKLAPELENCRRGHSRLFRSLIGFMAVSALDSFSCAPRELSHGRAGNSPSKVRALVRKPDAGNRLACKATCSRRNENAQNAN
jgi:hypothetical protein